MPDPLDTLLDRIRVLQRQLEEEWDARREELRYRLEKGRVVFDAEVRERHRAARVRLLTFLAATRPMVVLTAPLIYALIVPLVLLDLFASVYQSVCFRVYGIPRVRRGDFVVIDRQHLAYLNALQKLNCVYCGYANGLIAYVREVAARTEAYWCPIKHASRVPDPHRKYAEFLDFGDDAQFSERWVRVRENLQK